MTTCSECGEEMPEGVDCHHHSTTVEEYLGTEYTVCEDCPAYWPVRRTGRAEP